MICRLLLAARAAGDAQDRNSCIKTLCWLRRARDRRRRFLASETPSARNSSRAKTPREASVAVEHARESRARASRHGDSSARVLSVNAYKRPRTATRCSGPIFARRRSARPNCSAAIRSATARDARAPRPPPPARRAAARAHRDDGSLLNPSPPRIAPAGDRTQITRGLAHLERLRGRPARHALAPRSGIAAAHALRRITNRTNWPHILELYDALLALDPSPVVALNRTVALARVHGRRSR